MESKKDLEFYRDIQNEVEVALEHIEKAVDLLKTVSTKLGYDSRIATVLDSYIIGQLNGILGETKTSMFSIEDVIDDIVELQMECYTEEVILAKEVTKAEVLEMKGEGLVCLGCGGEVKEWIDGVNEILCEEGVTSDTEYFKEVTKFEDGDLTCLLFLFTPDSVLDIGKLAVARLKYAEWMKWLSDYRVNFGDIIAEDGEDDNLCDVCGCDFDDCHCIDEDEDDTDLDQEKWNNYRNDIMRGI